jgi:hypothetical protein
MWIPADIQFQSQELCFGSHARDIPAPSPDVTGPSSQKVAA